MPGNPIHDQQSRPVSIPISGPAQLLHYPALDLMAWQPQGILDDVLLEEIGEWLCTVDQTAAPVKRFVDLSRLESIAVRTKHVFEFARKRREQFAGIMPVRSAVFSEDWVGFGIALLYENLMSGSPVQARAFHDRAKAALWLELPDAILKLEDTPAPPN
jgi:hypothetical protein